MYANRPISITPISKSKRRGVSNATSTKLCPDCDPNGPSETTCSSFRKMDRVGQQRLHRSYSTNTALSVKLVPPPGMPFGPFSITVGLPLRATESEITVPNWTPVPVVLLSP